MEHGFDDQAEKWASRAAAARALGARSSMATVWVSAGGMSMSMELWWPGLGLAALDSPRARADLAASVEEELPDWLWSINEVPRADDGRGAVASFGMKPLRLESLGGRGDGRMVRAAMRPGALGERSALSVACAFLDEIAGGPSLRLRGVGGLGERDWALPAFWLQKTELALPGVESGGLRAGDFLLALEALACRQELGASTEAPLNAAAPRRV